MAAQGGMSDIMNRRESPFEEIEILRELMPNVLLRRLYGDESYGDTGLYPKNVN